jgi:hypothetical protein
MVRDLNVPQRRAKGILNLLSREAEARAEDHVEPMPDRPQLRSRLAEDDPVDAGGFVARSEHC